MAAGRRLRRVGAPPLTCEAGVAPPSVVLHRWSCRPDDATSSSRRTTSRGRSMTPLSAGQPNVATAADCSADRWVVGHLRRPLGNGRGTARHSHTRPLLDALAHRRQRCLRGGSQLPTELDRLWKQCLVAASKERWAGQQVAKRPLDLRSVPIAMPAGSACPTAPGRAVPRSWATATMGSRDQTWN